MARPYNVISGDSHIEISPERWTARVPAEWRDRAPRLVKLSSGGDGWIIENRPPYVLGLAGHGKPYQEHRLNGITYEGSPRTGSPEQRLREQELDGVDAEVMFTSVVSPRMWRALPDDGYQALVRAYNEFLGVAPLLTRAGRRHLRAQQALGRDLLRARAIAEAPQ